MGETGLGIHLAYYYWRGVGGAEARALLMRYFEECTPAAAAHVLWSMAQGLQGEEPLPGATLPALVDLWGEFDRRSPQWSELRRREVYRQFGQWFVSARFDNRWALERLKRAIEMGAGMLDVESLLERLAQLCGDYPRDVAGVLEPLLVDKRQLWQPVLWKDQVEAVLRALLNSPNEAARAQAEALVNQLVENGNLFARDLLDGRKASQR